MAETYILYVDEAGCTGKLPTATSEIQPVFVICGLLIEQSKLESFTHEFLNLKQKFFPKAAPSSGEFLDWIKVEIKGSELRKHVREGVRDNQRHAFGVMDKFLDLCEHHSIKLIGRIYIKEIGADFNGTAIYGSSIQYLSRCFQHFLTTERDAQGIMVLDSRDKSKNSNLSHTIFTQRFSHKGDSYSRLLDMPLFGHSDNHAGIQMADFISSALLFPMATYAYCLGHVNNVHVRYKYHHIRDMFGERLKRLQYRYQHQGKWFGGIVTSDAIKKQYSTILFGPQKDRKPIP
jgi:hypothetical protein